MRIKKYSMFSSMLVFAAVMIIGLSSCFDGGTAKDITKFTIIGIDGTIVEGTSGTISLTVPYGTNVTALVPTITITGSSVSPASGVAQNFTNPVVYTVKASGGTTKTYTATVSVALNPAKDITQFTIMGIDGIIDGSTISVTLPDGTSVTSLTPTIAITGASVNPASGAVQDFTNPVAYTVTAEDGSTKVYNVSVNAPVVEDPSEPTIVAASYLSVPAGSSVVYKGIDPSSLPNLDEGGELTEMTLTFNGDGTFVKVWTMPVVGLKTCPGTWSYDANHLLTTICKSPGTVSITTTEKYDIAFVYGPDNMYLTYYASKQTSTAPHGGDIGSTIIGTYGSHVYVSVSAPPFVNDVVDTVLSLNVVSGDPFPWNSITTTTKNGTVQDPVVAEGTLAIPDGVWLFNIGSEYFIQTNQMEMVLIKQ